MMGRAFPNGEPHADDRRDAARVDPSEGARSRLPQHEARRDRRARGDVVPRARRDGRSAAAGPPDPLLAEVERFVDALHRVDKHWPACGDGPAEKLLELAAQRLRRIAAQLR